jgi:hypothetical protein
MKKNKNKLILFTTVSGFNESHDEKMDASRFRQKSKIILLMENVSVNLPRRTCRH